MRLDCGIAIDQELANAVQWLRENFPQSVAIEWWDTIGRLEPLDMVDQFNEEERQETCGLLKDLIDFIAVAKSEADDSTVEYLVSRVVGEIQEIRQEQAESYQVSDERLVSVGLASSVVYVSTSTFYGEDYFIERHEEYEFDGNRQLSSISRGSAA